MNPLQTISNLHWVAVRSELGGRKRGASLGIGALRIASVNAGNPSFFKQHPFIEVEDQNQYLFLPSSTQQGKYIEPTFLVYQGIIDSLQEIYQKEGFPVVISGDHSVAGGVISAVKLAHPDKRVGVIWIDAHADLHSPYTSPTGNLHGMPLALVLGENNEELTRNEIEDISAKYWEELKEIGGICPKIYPEDLVQIAVRDTEEEEDALIAKHKIKQVSVQEVCEKGSPAIAQQALDYLSHCDLIYITFDVDSMDARLCPGTGTPVKDGLGNMQARELLKHLLKSPKIACWEISEINPLLDHENQVADLVFEIIEEVVPWIHREKVSVGVG